MKPKLEKISPNLFYSFAVKREITPYMDYPLHYHPEHEIIFVEKSRGLRVMGDNVARFEDGDLVFISSNLPHVWKNDKEYYAGNPEFYVDVYVIHFLPDALGDSFFDLPELNHISRLFELGQQGISILGTDHARISQMVKAVCLSSGFDRLINFLQLLDALSKIKEYELLSTPFYAKNIRKLETERLNQVIDYMMENYRHEITLDQLASIIDMNKASFCRYFKTRVHKTCTQFLNEIRITQACKLLLNQALNISEIGYEVGYNNISHFNRQFKLLTGASAKVYRKQLLNITN
ncbi:AraC family transcriptional regulator [Parapedobacter indicus]|uniref:AraC-type DNA-binding protein n=1 Tax=Parapedobacter indicus TaxID=1477437 RepID=A0A1I3HNY3_9SPHI|nr:AraC family transcriptional regulator [Parapedobacter indicus]PPL03114.1 AraC-like DNA-binding protein [Parapedobacter indicus]SFI37454.1 AraC-type DNA-binding protein [Parapedobacter indicus]